MYASNWICGLKMAICMTVIFVLVAFTSAGKLTNANDHKETSSPSLNNLPAGSNSQEHVIAKRAWDQLHGGWGKRSYDEEPSEDDIDELQRQALLRLYADQLNGYIPEADDDAAMEKRAWNSMNAAWGKRAWNELRGSGWGKRNPDNWNNMRGLWGKRAEKWGKLSSAWGRK
jgi:hypothetical protein